MTSDDAIRAAERSGDRAALVLALVRAGRGQEAVARCGLHVGDVVRRARNHAGWAEAGRPVLFEHGQLEDVGRVAARDPNGHSDQACVEWPTRWDGGWDGAWPSDVYTLDLVEPGDGECVLQAWATRATVHGP